jgi:arylsulfatase A-like enzyme
MDLQARLEKGKMLLPALLIVAGAGAVVLAVTADLLGSGGAGFGAGQIALAVAGVAVMLVGTFLATAPGRRCLHQWRVRIASDTTPASLLLVAIWFGLLTGWGETLFWFVLKFYLGRVIFADLDTFWMGPLVDLMLFACLGLVLTSVHRRWPRLISPAVAVSILAFVSYCSLLLLFRKLHVLAVLLLALGLAVQTGRMARGHKMRFHRLVRYSVGWPVFLARLPRESARRRTDAAAAPGLRVTRRQFLVGAGAGIAVTALGTTTWPRLRELLAVSALPPASSKPPNVLLIVLDTVRAQSLGWYGYPRPTSPQFDRLAQRGVCFKRAISTCSWTLPSHASMFTGHFPHRLSTGEGKPLDATYPTLAEILAARGYMTAGFAANTFCCSREFGLARGFVHYENYRVSAGQAIISTSLGRTARGKLRLGELLDTDKNFGRTNAERLNRDFLRWLSNHKDGRPFFAFLNYFDAHAPYLPPLDFALRFAPTRPRGHLTPAIYEALPGEAIQELNNAYDGAIAYLDHHLGLLFDELETDGRLQNTLVIITADHGEQFGEHGLVDHGNSLYMTLLHVPLVILPPSTAPHGVVVEEWVSLRDLAATVLAVTGMESMSPLPGQPLTRYWDSAARAISVDNEALLAEVDVEEPNHAGTALGPMKSLVSGGLHYIKYADDTEELYEVETDPGENSNLATSDEGRRMANRFRVSLEKMLTND